MKPPVFQYLRPNTLAQVLEMLDNLDDAKILAGGQSLIPMMNMRLARPGALIDINGLDELGEIREEDGGLYVGALVRHYQLQQSPLLHQNVSLISQAESLIGHEAIRTRGTIGGSLSHADPAAELPVLARLLDWEMVVQSAEQTRSVPAEEFFLSYFITALGPNEMVTGIRMTQQPGPGHIIEYAIRAGDFALAIAAATMRIDESGHLDEVRVALGGVADIPWRNPELELKWRHQPPGDPLWRDIAHAVSEEISPADDLHASADFRRSLAEHLVHQALEQAFANHQTVPGRA